MKTVLLLSISAVFLLSGFPINDSPIVYAQTDPPNDLPPIISCKVKRRPSDGFNLVLITNENGLTEDATVTIGGIAPNKLKFRRRIAGTNLFAKVVARGNICGRLPGAIVVTPSDGRKPSVFICSAMCSR